MLKALAGSLADQSRLNVAKIVVPERDVVNSGSRPRDCFLCRASLPVALSLLEPEDTFPTNRAIVGVLVRHWGATEAQRAPSHADRQVLDLRKQTGPSDYERVHNRTR